MLGVGGLFAGATAGNGVGASASLGGDLNRGVGIGQASAEAGGIQKQVVKSVSTNGAAAADNNANAAANVASSAHSSSFQSTQHTESHHQEQQEHQEYHHTSNTQTSHVESNSANHNNNNNNQNSFGYLPPEHNSQSSNHVSGTSTHTSTNNLAPVTMVIDHATHTYTHKHTI